MSMQDLAVDQIINLHDAIIARDGGDGRLLSEGNLHQLVFRANLIPDPVQCAAFAFYSLIAYPAFLEGNETLALEIASRIIMEGGYRWDPVDDGALGQIAEGITAFFVELEDTSAWFQAHARKES
jgi:hypothetical protein